MASRRVAADRDPVARHEPGVDPQALPRGCGVEEARELVLARQPGPVQVKFGRNLIMEKGFFDGIPQSSRGNYFIESSMIEECTRPDEPEPENVDYTEVVTDSVVTSLGGSWDQMGSTGGPPEVRFLPDYGVEILGVNDTWNVRSARLLRLVGEIHLTVDWADQLAAARLDSFTVDAPLVQHQHFRVVLVAFMPAPDGQAPSSLLNDLAVAGYSKSFPLVRNDKVYVILKDWKLRAEQPFRQKLIAVGHDLVTGVSPGATNTASSTDYQWFFEGDKSEDLYSWGYDIELDMPHFYDPSSTGVRGTPCLSVFMLGDTPKGFADVHMRTVQTYL